MCSLKLWETYTTSNILFTKQNSKSIKIYLLWLYFYTINYIKSWKFVTKIGTCYRSDHDKNNVELFYVDTENLPQIFLRSYALIVSVSNTTTLDFKYLCKYLSTSSLLQSEKQFSLKKKYRIKQRFSFQKKVYVQFIYLQSFYFKSFCFNQRKNCSWYNP